MILFALLLHLCACPARADDPKPADQTSSTAVDAPGAAPASAAPISTGWKTKPSSLVLYDASGSVTQEIGLNPWKENVEGGGVRRHTLRGGGSSDGHFAWSWEKIETYPGGQPEKTTEESRVMRYMGTYGEELWHDELADAPAGVDPVAISTNGEIVLVGERTPSDWIAAAVSYTGNRFIEAHGKGPIKSIMVTPSGSFALACFYPINQPPACLLLDIRKKSQQSVSLTDIPPTTPLRLASDGKVHVGTKLIFDPLSDEKKPQ